MPRGRVPPPTGAGLSASIHFLLVRRVPPVASPVLVDVFDILRSRGHRVSGSIAEEEVQRPDLRRPEHDVYVLKSHTQLSLGIAGVLHTQGAEVVEPYPACAATQNKIIAARLLNAAGVPAPRTWAIGDPRLLEEDVPSGRLIVKPYMGHRGERVVTVSSPAEIRRLSAAHDGEPRIVQEFVEGPGTDLKVYVVDDDVFAVRKRFSERSFTVPGRPVPVDPVVRDVARRAGRALGLGLFGLDVIESANGPVVVDANYFPGYKGVADAALHIAGYLERTVEARGVMPPPAEAPAAGRLALGALAGRPTTHGW